MNDLMFRKEHYSFIELSEDNFQEVCSFLGITADALDVNKGLSGVFNEIVGSESIAWGDYIFKTNKNVFCLMKKELFDHLFIRY